MAELNWSEKYAVGIRAIDDQHEELFAAVRGLEAAVARNAKAAETRALLKKLVAATSNHFEDEEAMMREAKYPGLALHAANHQRLMEKVEAFAARYCQSGATVNQHALNFLRDWLLYHIENDDARLGIWLCEHKAG
ncbi:MAG: bacteriohemerythrin [Terracidiphilus sp.]|jgi:hemerythrin-like metal-binding protein